MYEIYAEFVIKYLSILFVIAIIISIISIQYEILLKPYLLSLHSLIVKNYASLLWWKAYFYQDKNIDAKSLYEISDTINSYGKYLEKQVYDKKESAQLKELLQKNNFSAINHFGDLNSMQVTTIQEDIETAQKQFVFFMCAARFIRNPFWHLFSFFLFVKFIKNYALKMKQLDSATRSIIHSLSLST
jgi:hypothetical protein